MKNLGKKMLLLGLSLALLSSPIYATTTVPHEKQNSQAYEEMLKREAIEGESSEDEGTIQSIEEQIDTVYQNMLDKENYIVDLINTLNDNETTFSNWQYNLEYLNNNYDTITTIAGINIEYVDSYIEQYTYTLKSLQLPEEKTDDGISTFATYTRQDAVDYALDYVINYNTSYPDWSNYGDCANFISQAVYAGGKAMKGTPGTATAAQNWSNWFSKGTTQNTSNVSSTWRGAAAFRDYWQTNSSGYKKFTSMGSDAYSYGYRGDAISLLNANGAAYHTLIIVAYGTTDFKVAAHSDGMVTSAGGAYLLSKRSLGDGFIIYDMD